MQVLIIAFGLQIKVAEKGGLVLPIKAASDLGIQLVFEQYGLQVQLKSGNTPAGIVGYQIACALPTDGVTDILQCAADVEGAAV